VLDDAKREGMIALVREGSLVFLPTQREVTCPQLACSSANEGKPAPVVSTVVVAGPQFPVAPFADAPRPPQSPVHADGDEVEPALPDEPVAEPEKLPRREKPEPPGAETADADDESTEAAK
jgi:hypothetical protein